MIYFTLAANVVSVFLASGASVKGLPVYWVNVLECVFETRPTVERQRGGLNVFTNAHIQYELHAHTNRHKCMCAPQPQLLWKPQRAICDNRESCKCYQIYTHCSKYIYALAGFSLASQMLHYTNVRLWREGKLFLSWSCFLALNSFFLYLNILPERNKTSHM